MGEVIPLFDKDRRARKRGNIPPPPPVIGAVNVLVCLRNRDHAASCKELAEIAMGVQEALAAYSDSLILDCGFAKVEGEA